MTYELWYVIYGTDAQITAREEGCEDLEMDSFLEKMFLIFNKKQNGELGIKDKITYGNLQEQQEAE